MRVFQFAFLLISLILAPSSTAFAGWVTSGQGAPANVKLARLSFDFAGGGKVNLFKEVNGKNTLVTTANTAGTVTTNSYIGTAGDVYSKDLAAGTYNVFLVTPFNNAASNNTVVEYSVTFEDEIVGVAASNGWKNSQPGTMAVNVLGSHMGKFNIESALDALYGDSSYTSLISQWFGTGTQAVEIHRANQSGTANPDTMFVDGKGLSGLVRSPVVSGVNGLNEMFLVFTKSGTSTLPIPEPATAGLFGLGALLFGFARSRAKLSSRAS